MAPGDQGQSQPGSSQAHGKAWVTPSPRRTALRFGTPVAKGVKQETCPIASPNWRETMILAYLIGLTPVVILSMLVVVRP